MSEMLELLSSSFSSLSHQAELHCTPVLPALELLAILGPLQSNLPPLRKLWDGPIKPFSLLKYRP